MSLTIKETHSLRKKWIISLVLAVLAGLLSPFHSSAVVSTPPGCTAGGTCVSFEAESSYTRVDFGGQGWVDFSTVSSTPAGGSSGSLLALNIHEQPGDQLWAGTTFFSGDPATSLINDADKLVTANVYAPAAGLPVMMKLENSANGGIFVEASALTVTTGWQTLTFNYAVDGYSSSAVYNKASIFMNYGYVAAFSAKADRNWSVDDIRFPAAQPGAPWTACIRLSDANKASMTDKSYWWTNEPLSYSYVKFVVVGATLTLNYKVTDCSGTPLSGKTLTLTPNNWSTAASYTGSLSGISDVNGDVTFSLTNTNVDGQGESYPTGLSSLNYWHDSRSVSPEVKFDLNPSVGATTEHIDRVWTRIVNTEGYAAALAAQAFADAYASFTSRSDYFEPQSPAGASLNTVAKTFTCTSPASKATPTYAAYYLFVNRQLVSAKRVGAFAQEPRYPAINAAVDGVTTLQSATFDLDSGWNANGNSASLRCDIQIGTSVNSQVVSTPTVRLAGVGKYIRKPAKSSTVANPSAVTMRLVSPVLTKDADGKPVDYVDFKNSPKDDGWAQYYGDADGGLGVFYRYLTAGSTLNLKYLVTDSETKKPLANYPVWLMVNKNYGGVQRGSWSYENNGKFYEAKPLFTEIGETQYASATDAFGYVSFTIVNTNLASESEPKPEKLNAIQPASVSANVQSTITLTARLSGGEVKETKDFLWIHIVQP